MLVFGYAEGGEKCGRIAFRCPAAHFLERVAQFAYPEPVLVGEIRLGVYGVHFGFYLGKAFVAHYHGVQYRVAVESVVVLREYRHAFVGFERYGARRWVYFAGEDFEECRFTRAVGPYHTVTVAAHEFQVDVFEKHPLSELEG